MPRSTDQDFINFCDSKMKTIGKVLGEYGTKGRMLDVVAEISKS